jgi:hypothetical protein
MSHAPNFPEPMVGVQRIKWRFDRHYAQFGIQFPLRSVRLRLPGEIVKDGWMVLYQWGGEVGERVSRCL